MNNTIIKRFIFSRIKNHIDNFLNKKEEKHERFITILGLRGSGKTTLLEGIREYLINKKISENITIIDNLKINNYNLELYINKILTTLSKNPHTPIFLLFDDIDRDPKWASILKAVYENYQNTFIITTSSSILKLEINGFSNLAGRVRREYIFPLNFVEYLKIVGKIDKHLESNPIKNLLLRLLSGSLSPEKFIDKLSNDDKKIIIYDELRSFSDEFENFLKYGGFPLSALKKESYKDNLFQIIKKILSEDIPTYYQYLYGEKFPLKDPYPKKILYGLADADGTNIDSLSNILKINKEIIENFLYILEEAFLIISVIPYGNTNTTIIKKPKYYFITPTIRFMLKKQSKTFTDYVIGFMFEDYIASSLYKITKTYDDSKINFFYDRNKNSSDFLIKTENNKIIPIEVKLGKNKDAKNQVKNSMERYKSEYGIIIGDYELYYKDNILYIPKELFSVL
jgi:predicted AAA+ superfamily ATPase